MFDYIELSNCPDKFALNCKRYNIKCHECLANNKGKHLLYLPINKSIKDHPAKNEPKKSKSTTYSRKGIRQEQKTIESSSVLKRTIGSGSYVGDGDAVVNLGDFGKIRVEHKTRYNDKNLYSPTSSELKEGLTQKIKIWYIANGKRPYSFPYVFVNYNLLMKLIQVIFAHNKIIVKKDSYLDNTYTIGYKYVSKSSRIFSPIDLAYNYIIIKRGLNPGVKNLKQINFYRFIVAKTPYGKFCYMDGNLFENLVKLYKEII